MLRFNKNVEERKTIAHRLGELTGIQPFYTRAPLYTYEVGPYVIDREVTCWWMRTRQTRKS